MWKPSRKILITFAVATIAGAALHFAYALFPNMITALFSPVNESVWEHVKLLFWPYLVALLLLTKGGGKGCRAPWLLSLLVVCGLMLGVGYIYYILMGGTATAFGPVLYVVLMAIGFVLPSVLWWAATVRWVDAIYLAVIVLGMSVLMFTSLPPNCLLFTDLSGANTWTLIPW